VYQSLIIVDDFYPDPEEVRRAALSCEYPEVAGPRTFPGRNLRQKLVLDGLEPAVSRLVGEPVHGFSDQGSTHGKFRVTLAGEPSRYLVHVDPTAAAWVGVVYLNPPDQCRGGTAFFRHKGLGSDRTPLTPAELEAQGVPSVAELLRRDGNDRERWEHLMTVPMRFNRLALYRLWLWHSAGDPFGASLEDGRLIQLVAFRPTGAAAHFAGG
jgi:hypothetical protein